MISKFLIEKASIVELDKVTKHSRMPKINKEACFMTLVEEKTKERADLEA